MHNDNGAHFVSHFFLVFVPFSTFVLFSLWECASITNDRRSGLYKIENKSILPLRVVKRFQLFQNGKLIIIQAHLHEGACCSHESVFTCIFSSITYFCPVHKKMIRKRSIFKTVSEVTIVTRLPIDFVCTLVNAYFSKRQFM